MLQNEALFDDEILPSVPFWSQKRTKGKKKVFENKSAKKCGF